MIVADDLSGAADSAAALAPRARTAVTLDASAAWPPAADVVAVDTDSRHLPAADAAAAAAAAVGRAAPHTLVYKKIDSTLRGSIGPETAAALSVMSGRPQGEDGRAAPGRPRSGRFLAVVAPAFPATGRTVLHGEVRVDGEPLAYRRPERRPLTDQLRAAGLEVARLSLGELRRDRPATSLRAMAGHVDAVVVDALTDDDLARTVRACKGLRVLLVGSGGLARHLPLPSKGGPATGHPAAGHPAAGHPADSAACGSGAGRGPDPVPSPVMAPVTDPVTDPVSGSGAGSARPPVLFCVGSRSETAHAQRRALLDGVPAVPVPVRADAPADAPADVRGRAPADARGARDVADAARQAAAALEDGRDVVVFPDPDAPVEPHRAGEVAAALASVASAGLCAAGTLVATGGETARAVLRRADVATLEVLGESEPGVVWMSTPGRLRVITKAGSFGDAGTLLRVARSLSTDGAAVTPGRPPCPL
nr:four-carbon acid sugar kinase family protein [Streptomyces sp. HNM0575]